MSKVVFILGAGASKECGAPLMAEFLDVAHKLHSTGRIDKKKEHFDRVFKAIAALQNVHSKAQLDLNNIESIFTTFEIANVLGKLPSFNSEEIPAVIASLKELIVTTLENTISFPVRQANIHTPKQYLEFAKLLNHLRNGVSPNQTVSIITFNYDIILDMALYQMGAGPDYALGSAIEVPKPISLLKLHGSLNWASMCSNKSVKPLMLNDYFKKYSLSYIDGNTCTIPIGSQLKEYFTGHTDIEVNDGPVIVPPTWSKGEYHQTLFKVWNKAAKELGEAERIFIIGYSLPETDAFFRYLYALGCVGDTLIKDIVVYNTDKSDDIKKRFKNMLGPGAIDRYKYKSLSFSESLVDIKGYF